jgi:hypothetical protein
MATDEPEARQAGEGTGDKLDTRRDGPAGEGTDLTESALDSPAWPGQASFGAIVVAMEQTTGPLPSAEWLDAVEKHFPGVTKALVEDYLAERKTGRELLHRAADFDETSFGKFARYQYGQLWTATALALVISVGGIVLALAGKSLYGFALLVFEVAGLLLAFLYGRARDGESPPPAGDS